MDDSRIRSKTALFLFENGLVWTEPQWEYEEATHWFEKDPSDYNRSRLNEIKEKTELFYKEKRMELLYVQELASMSMEKEARSTF